MQITADQDDALRWPRLTDADHAAVKRVLDHGDLSAHPVLRELEDAYAHRFERRHALSHANGTSALAAAFFALDLAPGDEVIVPSATWWASVSPMLHFGLVPVFADSDPVTLGLDPVDVARKITPRTRAMVVVHLWGLPAAVNSLTALAHQHHLRVVEDASHAHGASVNAKPCGAFGDVSVFSLQGAKLAPAGEGGVLLTDDTSLFERATLLGDVNRIIELPGPERRFAATGFGMKTRMAPLSAAVGLSQLNQLDAHNAARADNISRLQPRLEAMGLHTYPAPPRTTRTWFAFLIRNDIERTGITTDTLLNGLLQRGARVSPARYPLLHQQPFFTEGHAQAIARGPLPDYASVRLPYLESLADDCLSLPTFPTRAPELIDQYGDAFEDVIHSA